MTRNPSVYDILSEHDLNLNDLYSFNSVWGVIHDLDAEEVRECFQCVLDSLTMGSGYWMSEEGVRVWTEQSNEANPYGYAPTTCLHLAGGELEGEQEITMGRLQAGAIAFCTWWLIKARDGGVNEYVTRAARKFMGGDFDGWACDADVTFCDLMLQHMLFGEILFG